MFYGIIQEAMDEDQRGRETHHIIRGRDSQEATERPSLPVMKGGGRSFWRLGRIEVARGSRTDTDEMKAMCSLTSRRPNELITLAH